MTTSAAENLAGRAGEKEKVEKRRALGRGLESLLPGPRVVSPNARPAVPRGAGSGGDAGTRAGVPGPHGLAVPQGASAPHPGGEAITGVIRAVAQEAVDEALRAGALAPHESAGATGSRSPGPPAAGIRTPESEESIKIARQAELRVSGNIVVNLAIADIDKNPFQTRYISDNDKLEELANSIKANGVVQPIVVRPSEDEGGRYTLILGERRLHASKKAGKDTIPAMVRRVSLQQAAEMTIVENLQRDDLSALEQAEAFRILSKEFQLTQAQIGERVGISRESVSNYMRLLKLPREVMQLLGEKKISFSEARELLKLENDDQITQGALYAVKNGLTLEQIERMVLSMNGLSDPFPGMPGQVVKKSSGARWVDPNVRAAQLELEQMLGVRVRIRDRKGKGKIVIEYHTVDDYERVVEMLRGKK
jgi:ParB family chromosome partitioning protein